MNKSTSLYLLQQIDLQLDALVRREKEISALIADRSSIERAEAQLTGAILEREHAESKLIDIENKIKASRIKMQQSESSLYGGKIQNPKELQDFQTELAILKKQIAALEEDEFNAMVHVDEKQTTEHSAGHFVEQSIAEKEREKDVFAFELADIGQSTGRLQSERAALTANLDPDLLAIYDKLRKTKMGIPVTQVEDNTCEKCGAEITQAEWQKARISPDLYYCPTCGRIIYGR